MTCLYLFSDRFVYNCRHTILFKCLFGSDGSRVTSSKCLPFFFWTWPLATLFVVLQCYLLCAVLNTKASDIGLTKWKGAKTGWACFLLLLMMLFHDEGEAYNPFWKIITTKHRPCSLFHVRLACMLVWFSFIEEDMVGFSPRCFSKLQPYSATNST